MYPVLKIMHMLNFLDTFSVGVTHSTPHFFSISHSITSPIYHIIFSISFSQGVNERFDCLQNNFFLFLSLEMYVFL